MIKLIKWLKNYLPITRKEYYDSLKKVTVTLQGIAQADEQHSQIEMNLVQNMNMLKTNKKPEEKATAPKSDPSYE